MNRGLKLIATFWIFATAIAAGQLLRTIVLLLIKDFARGNPGLGSAIVTVIAVAPVVLVTFLTRAWRQDLRVLRQTDYWTPLFAVGAQRVRALSKSLAPSPGRNRASSEPSGNSGIRAYLHRNRLGVAISSGIVLVVLALVAAYGLLGQRTGQWETIGNPRFSEDPPWAERVVALQVAAANVAAEGIVQAIWDLPENEWDSRLIPIIHSYFDEEIAALPQGVRNFEFMSLAAGGSSPHSTSWRIRFKLPSEVRAIVDSVASKGVQIVAFISLTDRDGYVLDTAEWPLDDATFPDLGRWTCLGQEEKKRRLAALGPTLVFKGSDEGDFLPGQTRSISLSLEPRDGSWRDYSKACGSM